MSFGITTGLSWSQRRLRVSFVSICFFFQREDWPVSLVRCSCELQVSYASTARKSRSRSMVNGCRNRRHFWPWRVFSGARDSSSDEQKRESGFNSEFDGSSMLFFRKLVSCLYYSTCSPNVNNPANVPQSAEKQHQPAKQSIIPSQP